jgi:Cu+-exporting ATPase
MKPGKKTDDTPILWVCIGNGRDAHPHQKEQNHDAPNKHFSPGRKAQFKLFHNNETLFHHSIYIVSPPLGGNPMNNLLIVALLTGLTIAGFVFIMEAGAHPSAREKTIGTPPIPSGLGNLAPMVDGKQDIYLKATKYGTYSPSSLKVKKGIPVRIHYSADEGAGCGREVIFDEFKIRKLAPSQGEALIEFTPQKTGKFPFHCSMRMFNGIIEVVA